jgi:outer membrane assembly lipoprotein YfiO
MKDRFLGLVLFWGIFFLASINADWVWTPEVGWINTKYNQRANVPNSYKQGIKLMEQKQYNGALAVFKGIIQSYPYTPEGKNSLYLAGECEYKSENHYEAYLFYEEYFKQYPQTDRLQEILEKEYEIGTILIRGKGKKHGFLGIRLSSSAPRGAEILKKVIEAAPYKEFADDAQFTIANYYFKRGEYQEAQDAYTKLVKEYPKSEWREFAQYQIAICARRQFRGSPYDHEALLTAQKKLSEYFAQNPDGRQKEAAQKASQEIQEALAKKEFAVAMFYLDRDHTHSAKIYFRYIVKQFPGTKTAEQAKLMLVKLEKK